MKWGVIWQVDPDNLLSCIERDWFYEVMSQVPLGASHIDYQNVPQLKTVIPYSIICASCPNQVAPRVLGEYIRRFPEPRVLYHMSDEFIKVGRELYEYCNLVIRNGSINDSIADESRCIQLPLGYVTGLGNHSQWLRPSSERKSTFAFLGSQKHERMTDMLVAFGRLKDPNIVRTTNSFAAATRRFDRATVTIYRNTIFVPNPKGNWNPECNRLYDCLEWGCIPLTKRYDDSDYHRTYFDRLLGRNPLPMFETWTEAVDFAEDLLREPGKLDLLQQELMNWWRDLKRRLQADLALRLRALTTS
jgi:hypothetical protein